VLTIGWAAVYFALDMPPAPAPGGYRFDLAEVRALASRDGVLPVRINSLVVGEGAFPSKAAMAGASLFTKTPIVITSFQVVYDDRTVIVDTAHDASMRDWPAGEVVHMGRFRTMQAAMQRSALILVTHEHGDHIGGISRSPHLDEISAKTMLTQEQLTGPSLPQAHFPPGSLRRFTPLEYGYYYSPSPGLVLIKAPGHTPGSQMIYARLRSGREYLFIGDIAWTRANIATLVSRPWFVSRVIIKEDAAAVAAQLRVLHQLAENRAQPISLVIAHDPASLRDQVRAGLIGDGFE
jgi:glyoxylase-like metal-dependent hydrolase (beta-lactamase superfamily II)